MSTYEFDAWNRLARAQVNGKWFPYEYDALGRRIVEGSNPGTGDFINESTHVHLYYNANWQVVQETNYREDSLGGTYDTTVSNVWSPAYIDAMVLRDTDFIYDDGGLGFGQFSSGQPGVQRPTPPDGRVYVQQDEDWSAVAIPHRAEPSNFRGS